MAADALRLVDGEVRLVVTARPRSSHEGLTEKDGAVRVAVNAAPVDGEASIRVVAVVAEALNLRRSDVQLVRGATSRHKELLLRGVTLQDAERRLAGALERPAAALERPAGALTRPAGALARPPGALERPRRRG